jgi:hypothetical protein
MSYMYAENIAKVLRILMDFGLFMSLTSHTNFMEEGAA